MNYAEPPEASQVYHPGASRAHFITQIANLAIFSDEVTGYA
jgi:hypothetical protein